MVGDIFQPTHLLFVLVVALLVLGPKRLPEVGRTLGAGIRDFRQAISGESPDPPQRQDSEQVATTTAEPDDASADSGVYNVNWPEEAAADSPSFDEPADLTGAGATTGVVAEHETTATFATDAEPATAVVTEAEPATEVVTDTPRVADLDSLYFDAPDGEAAPDAHGSDSTESHADHSS